MTKYLSEQTLRNIQYGRILPKRLEERRDWIYFACKLAMAYYPYHFMRDFASMANQEERPSIQEAEELIVKFNNAVGTEMGLSDYLNAEDDADTSIDFYNRYKAIVGSFDNKYFKPDIAEIVFNEIYEIYERIPLIGIFFGYCSDMAWLTLQYMGKIISYEAFIQEASSIKFLKNPKPLNGRMLEVLVKTWDRWIKRYKELEEEKEKKVV